MLRAGEGLRGVHDPLERRLVSRIGEQRSRDLLGGLKPALAAYRSLVQFGVVDGDRRCRR